MPQIVLLGVALVAAWRPAETAAMTPLLVAVAVLALLPWAHRRTPAADLRSTLLTVGVVGVALVLSAAGGWDRSSATAELGLAAAVAALAWIASREAPEERMVRWLALGLAALSLWAAWQVAFGFSRAEAAVAALPELLQANAAERLASGRAFASLLLPGHLAAVLATALPILVTEIRGSWRSAGWIAGCALCGVGLVLTRSPIGIGLAILALAALAARRRRPEVLVAVLLTLALALTAVVWLRPDVAELEPVRLRLDNWRTATWAWRGAPLTGVGFGSYGQATREVPFDVGNLPAHAHSLPMEWLAEGGVVGIAAWTLAALWLAGLLRRLWPVRPELAVAVAVVPLHNLVDFSLYTSGVALPWAVLLGWSAAVARGERTDAVPARHRELLVAAAAAGVALALLHAASVTVERAGLAAAEAQIRLDDALTSQRLAPWRASPPLLAAEGAVAPPHDTERLTLAEQALRRGQWWRPRSAALAAAQGEVALARGHLPTAAADLWTAQRLQPHSSARAASWDELSERLEELGRAARP